MEKKTIVKLSIAGLAVVLATGYACGIGQGGAVNYQIPGPYTAEDTNDFSTVKVEATVQGDQITDCAITSSGDSDLLNDETRAEWAQSIVDNQTADNDVISGATLTYSAASVKKATDDILVQAGLKDASEIEEAAEAEAEPAEAEAEPTEEEGVPADGVYAIQKTTDFSTIDVEITAEDGKVTAARVASAPLEGQVDMLTDDIRNAWAEQIVEKQAIDAVSGVTVSSEAVQEAVEQLTAQFGDDEPSDTYATQKTTAFSTIDVEMTVKDGAVSAAKVASAPLEGQVDMLTDDIRNAWADQIVDKQAVDAVSGVTVSSDAAQEAVAELVAQAREDGVLGGADPKVAELEAAAAAAVAAQAVTEPEAAPEAEASGLVDGTYAVRKTTDFSDIDVAITVLDSKLTQAVVSSEGANDLLTDENRAAWADQILENQAVDAVSGVTVSSNAVQEAVAELLAEAQGGEEEAAKAETETANTADASRLMRARPAFGEATEETPAEAETEAAASADASRLMRARPAFGAAAEEAPAEAETETVASADASRLMRARPAFGEAAEEAPAEAETETAASADASRLMRARPAFAAAAEAEEADAAQAELTGDERLAAILPYIVTTMGDNRENSYVVDYLEQDPYLVNIYEGYGFAKDYGSARGHEYTLEDVAKTQRPHPKANCITCKTPDLHKMIEEQGVAVYSMPFDEVFPQMTNNVSCYTCHGDDMGNGGAMVVTHQYVNEALGENVADIYPATLSCGQCHIEYYFTPADSETMMPYHSVDQMTPEAILAYYDELGFADWTQESTGTPMLKAQHPEMETFLQGKHAAFLSCADCHMPNETTADGVPYVSHMLVSPLENQALLASCAQCHGDTDMVEFVHGIQQNVTARETEVGNKLSAMKDALADANASGEWSEDDLNAVRKLHREAQWFFDYCYVENSEGAHNSQLSLSCLDTSEAKIDEAMQLLEGHTT